MTCQHPSPFWYCDVCGEKITNVKHGWLEWLHDYGSDAARGLRLVHHDYSVTPPRTCQYRSKPPGWGLCDGPLDWYLGIDGRVDLLELDHRYTFDDRKAVLTMFMRLHVPGYEQVRRYFKQAVKDNLAHVNSAAGVYRQDHINVILQHYAPEYLSYCTAPCKTIGESE